jgi:hypothetical protein
MKWTVIHLVKKLLNLLKAQSLLTCKQELMMKSYPIHVLIYNFFKIYFNVIFYVFLIHQTAGHGSQEVACLLFARSEAGTVGSNPTQSMDV